MDYTIFSNDLGTLSFPDDKYGRKIYDEYKQAERKAALKTYAKVRSHYGIWASNQDRFVGSPRELNRWDSHKMEDAYQLLLEKD